MALLSTPARADGGSGQTQPPHTNQTMAKEVDPSFAPTSFQIACVSGIALAAIVYLLAKKRR